MTAPRHLDALTGLRGIAAWMVVLYHVRLSLLQLLPGGVIAVLARGYLAVDLFFMLSGFVIWYNYEQRLREGGWNKTRQFLWRRFARVWPLHAAVLAGFVGFAVVLKLSGRPVSNYPFAELPLHVLLIQNWGLTKALAWNHPAWSISTEFAAYLLFPVVVSTWRSHTARSIAVVGAVAALAASLYALFAVNGYDRLGEDITGLGLARCLIEFAMGSLMCLLWARWSEQRRAALCAALGCFSIAIAGAALRLPEIAIVPIVFWSALFAVALDRGKVAQVLASSVPRYLGEISYSTYLAHFGLFIVYKMAFVGSGLQLSWMTFGGFLLMVLLVSMGLYHGLEKPAQRWLSGRGPGLRTPAPAIA